MREGANKTLITMKKLLMIFAILFAATSVSAQEIYKEVKRIQKQAETFANDTTKNLDERKIACFKYDAIYYMMVKAGDNHVTAYELGNQTSAMIDFVNLYIKRLSMEKKKSQRDIIMSRFKKVTIENALFNDMDKDIIYAYIDNDNFITQFSLDTNWVKALEEVRRNN